MRIQRVLILAILAGCADPSVEPDTSLLSTVAPCDTQVDPDPECPPSPAPTAYYPVLEAGAADTLHLLDATDPMAACPPGFAASLVPAALLATPPLVVISSGSWTIRYGFSTGGIAGGRYRWPEGWWPSSDPSDDREARIEEADARCTSGGLPNGQPFINILFYRFHGVTIRNYGAGGGGSGGSGGGSESHFFVFECVKQPGPSGSDEIVCHRL